MLVGITRIAPNMPPQATKKRSLDPLKQHFPTAKFLFSMLLPGWNK